MRHSNDEPEDDQVIPAPSESVIAAALCQRIRREAKSAALYRTYGREALHLLWLWKTFGSPGEMDRSLRASLNSSSDEVDLFLDAFVGRGWGMESGLSHRLDFDRHPYDQLTGLADPEFIAKKVLERHKNLGADDAEFEPTTTEQTYRKMASQFLAVHKAVMEKKDSESSPTASEPPDDSKQS